MTLLTFDANFLILLRVIFLIFTLFVFLIAFDVVLIGGFLLTFVI
jgi:hypothetical protein